MNSLRKPLMVIEAKIYHKYAYSSCLISSKISNQGLSLLSITKLKEEDILNIKQKLKEIVSI
ncbi:MAG: hypothetical protein QW201_02750 [Thermoproteota archaeon]